MTQLLPLQLQSQKILVVDDNPASRYSTSRILRSAGFQVAEAGSGSAALDMPDDVGLLILDINLPDMDGFDVCRQLRARSRTAYLPIVHLSATFMDTADMAQGLAAGADSYLIHPADPAVLVATVRALLFARQADINKRAADARFRAVFELASSGIALLDDELTFKEANASFCAIAAREPQQLVGSKLSSILPPERVVDAQSLREHLREQDSWQGTLPVLRADGQIAEVEWRIASEPGSGNRIAIATDVTDRRRADQERERLLAGERAARAEAERSNQLKDEFLATLSHELRNPLNAILGWAKVLGRTSNNPPIVTQGLEAIERNSRVQSHLIEDLLDFAGIRFGKMRVEMEVVSPAATVKSALDVVAQQAAANGVTLLPTLRDADARVIADESRLQQIVWNLLSNAIKFTPREGRVSIDAGIRDADYQIEIRDTGRGIRSEFLPQIFDRFSQQDSGANKRFAGLGIGLSIVRHLVEAHHGSIEAHSEGEGQGATFRVRLPLTQQRREEQPIKGASLLAGTHVLVVEDDVDARALIVRLLTDAGAEVSEASGADEAFAQVGLSTPNVLVSDIGMAQKDGYQLIRALRAGGYSADRLPAIALTAFSRAQDRSDALNAGFQVHLTKPVNAEALTAAVAKLEIARQRIDKITPPHAD